MNKIPENILNLMRSDAYVNSNNPEHQNVAKQIQNYFENKYGNSTIDATGRNITIRKAWCWHAIIDERTCEDCASFSDTIYENEEDIPEQARQIYGEDYYDERRIGDIENERIANAIFDMGVMSNFNNVGKIVQETLNDSMGEDLKIDGKIGDKTLDALNNIPDNKIDDFMQDLKENRIEYLQGLSDWDKYGNGWTSRTNRY